MLPPTIAPRLKGSDGEVAPAICRVSPDLSKVAFWVDRGERRGLYVGDTEWAEEIGEAAERVWAGEGAELADLAWSGDGAYLAFRLAGELARVGVLRLAGREVAELPGAALAWAGRGATLLVADAAGSRLYLKDLELGVEHRICEIIDDGDAQFPPVISVSPDQRRFALVTRRTAEGATHVHLAQHDGRQWQATPVTQVPGVGLRILPFWTADSAACGLYVIDPEQHHTAMIAVPDEEGAGDILYTSDTVDAVITPAVHPDGRLIAFVRAHPRGETPSLVENRLVLLDPVERAVAPISADAEVAGKLRWLDEQTLLVEGGPAVWTVKLRAALEPAQQARDGGDGKASPVAPGGGGHVRTTIDNADPALAFSCEIPADWERTPVPELDVDFSDPDVMRPLCLIGPTYATMFFAVSMRPLIHGQSPAAALASLARVQAYQIGEVRPVHLRAGAAAEAEVTQGSGGEAMRGRVVMLEDGGRLFSIVALAPAPLWEGVRHILDSVVESFALVNPRGATVGVLG